MTDLSVDEMTGVLAKADSDTLKEIVREAESFLGAQLQCALAADQRAMTLAGILGAVVSLMIGGMATMIAGGQNLWPHSIPLGILIISLLVALGFAIAAARPTEFYYVGNSPNFWLSDITKGQPFTLSMAQQAALYAGHIERNDKIMTISHRYTNAALFTSYGGTVLAAAVEFIIVLAQFGAPSGFPKLG